MTIHRDNMNEVPDWGENVPPDTWYHVRVAKVEEKASANSGEPTAYFQLKVLDEPYVGRVILDNASLAKHALGKIKNYYKATDYFPGPEGHDPEQLLDRECYVKPTGRVYKGGARLEIAPHNIRSVRDGRPQ